MNQITKEFQGVAYTCRVIPDYDNKGHSLIVAPNTLNILYDWETNQHISEEAQYLDSEICYYANEEEMQLSDRELFDLIYNQE